MSNYIQARVMQSEDEAIEYLAHISLWSFVPHFLIASVLMAASVSIMLGTSTTGMIGANAPYAAALLAGLGLIALGRMLVVFYTTEIGVTNQRVILKIGWLSRQSSMINLEKIEMHEVVQSAMGRMLKFGNLDIRAAGMENLVIRGVDRPNILSDYVDQAKRRRLAASTPYTVHPDLDTAVGVA